MPYIILNWTDPSGAGALPIVKLDDNDNVIEDPQKFNTYKEAEEYAEEELNHYWAIVRV